MKKTLIIISTFITTILLMFCFSNTSFKIKASTTYNEPSTDFRAAWVSYYTGDVSYKNEQDYKNQINTILDNLEYYNMNALIFHIRANHDAWYNSKINRINSQLANVNFSEFDPLEYVITEAHKRGIEFHAWLNPYRIGAVYESVEEVTSAFSKYPNNPASQKENVLIGSPLQILNPAVPEVRQFIIDTCMEIVENYDVDAIHFDDYFYANGIDDSASVAKYNTNNLPISDFRRLQVDTFIHDLKQNLDTFNRKNNRFVQLGISPTGVYKNANSSTEAKTPLENYKYNENGDLIYPIGATTGCQMHYQSYLYCDTLKWVNNGWINYILPQTYWSTTHSSAPFERLINWWNMAVKNKDVNLYAGMGIYMWTSQTGEALKQLQITSNLANVSGTSLYSYRQIATSILSPTGNEAKQMNDIKKYAWKNKAILPEIAGMDKVKLGSVKNLSINQNKVSWDKLEGAKFYLIYASKDIITYHNDEIVAIVGGNDELLSWTNPNEGNYNYDVVPMSYTNTLGEPSTKAVEEITSTIQAQILIDNTTKLDIANAYNLPNGRNAQIILEETASFHQPIDYNWSSSNEKIARVDENGMITSVSNGTTLIKGTLKTDESVYAQFYINVFEGNQNEEEYIVTFVDSEGKVIKKETVKYGSDATPPIDVAKEPTQKYTFTFEGFDKSYINITSSIVIKPVYKSTLRLYTVQFMNGDNTIYETKYVPYGSRVEAPIENPTMADTVEYRYRFVKWENLDQEIISDTTILAVYNQIEQYYVLTFDTNGGNNIVSTGYYYYENINSLPTPTKENARFGGWYLDSEFTMPCKTPFKLEKRTTIYAKWNSKVQVNFYDINNNLYKTVEAYTNDLLPYEEMPVGENNQLIGWKKSGETENFDFNQPLTESIDLYPVISKITNPPTSSDNGSTTKCTRCSKSSITIVFISCITFIGFIFLKRKKH